MQIAIAMCLVPTATACVLWAVLRVHQHRYWSAMTMLVLASVLCRLSVRWIAQEHALPHWLDAVSMSRPLIFLQLQALMWLVCGSLWEEWRHA